MRKKSTTDRTNETAILKEKIKQLEYRMAISETVDSIIEKCFKEHRDLAATLEEIFDYVEKEFKPKMIFLRTQNEDLILTLFARGIATKQFEEHSQEMMSIEKAAKFRFDETEWFVISLDLAGESIGVFGMAFPDGQIACESEIFAQMKLVAEEMDNYFYSIHQSRYKYMMIIELQRCLKTKILEEAFDTAINIIGDMVQIEDLILLYLDEDIGGKNIVQYVVYRNYQRIYDSFDKPMPELEKLLGTGKNILVPGNSDLANVFPLGEATETILLDGLVVEKLVGKILLKPPKGFGLSIASREIIKVFSEALRQRLVDFNREKNNLRQFFSPQVTHRLLKDPDYKQKFLTPHKAEIGIIFADICGFTKMSEKVLRDPSRIAKFVNNWSNGVVERAFSLSGTLDKVVGDCIILLFGPPFYDLTSEDIAERSLQAAFEIINFTGEFLTYPENEDIRRSSLKDDFGVAIGVNFCPSDVGLIGPNQDLTAFSSGMNNTARLQHLAHKDEILVMSSIKNLVIKNKLCPWKFDGPFLAQVKNVQDPLEYFRLANKRS